MLALRAAVRPAATRPDAFSTFVALYSTVSGLARRKWGVTGPGPASFVESESEVADEDTTPTPPRIGRGASLRSRTGEEPTPGPWRAHRERLKELFPEGWSPPRKLSREAMDGLRSFNALDPETFTTPVLAEKFRISPEAVRRILKSKWLPTSAQRSRMIGREREAREKWIRQRRTEEREKQQSLTRRPASKDKLSFK